MGPIVEAMQEPFQSLEYIRITATNAAEPPVLVREAFLGGSAPRLREIKLDGIAFPFSAIRQVFSSSANTLVELHLANIPNHVYFSPHDLLTGLKTLVQLKRLTVGFHPPHSSLSPSMAPPQRTTLPSLIFLKFCGACDYLEEFVAQIDVPALCEIAIMLFNDISFEIPQFCRFIPLLNALASPTGIFVTHFEEYIGVSFIQENPWRVCYTLGTLCHRLDWQLSFVTQISSQLSPRHPSVHSLDIWSIRRLATGEEDVDSTQWLEFFQPFTHVKKVQVFEKKLVPGIVQALVAEDMATGVLPELTCLHLEGYRDSPSVAKAAEQFVATRRLSNPTIYLTDAGSALPIVPEDRVYVLCPSTVIVA
jgi:hypothetical protein